MNRFHQLVECVHECRLVNSEGDNGGFTPPWYFELIVIFCTVSHIPISTVKIKRLIKIFKPKKFPKQILRYNGQLSTMQLYSQPRIHEQVWHYDGLVSEQSAAVFKITVPAAANCELTVSFSQGDKRIGGHLNDENPHLPLLLKVFEEQYRHDIASDIALITLSDWGHTRDCCTTVKVMDRDLFGDDKITLYVHCIPVGTQAFDPSYKMVSRFYSTCPVQITCFSTLDIQNERLVEIMRDRVTATIPYSFVGWTAVGEPKMYDSAEGRGRPYSIADDGSEHILLNPDRSP